MEDEVVDIESYNPEDFKEEEVKEGEKVKPTETEVPEKYKGKSLEDVVKMHTEAEKVISRQGNDIHELRRSMEDNKKGQEDDPWADESDDVVDKRVVDKLNKLEQELSLSKRQREFEKFENKHPDWAVETEEKDFQAWVKDSQYRLGLWDKATKTDYSAADELFSGWEDSKKGKTAQPVEDVSSAQLEKRGRTGTRKPVFRRADLINLRVQNPAKYEAMSTEIHEAYHDGRVV